MLFSNKYSESDLRNFKACLLSLRIFQWVCEISHVWDEEFEVDKLYYSGICKQPATSLSSDDMTTET